MHNVFFSLLSVVSEYDKSIEEQLLRLKLIKPPVTSPEKSPPDNKLQVLSKEVVLLKERIRRYQKEVSLERETLADMCTANQELLQRKQIYENELKEKNSLIESFKREQKVNTSTMTSPPIVSSNEIELWQVPPNAVIVEDNQVLGRGTWGYVAKGKFRGTAVAVKRVYPEIFQQTTVERICREIHTMAQIRHPNLVLFIAAVMPDEKTEPMIVTELLDTSLRQAYQKKLIGRNERNIFQDVASALVYLHQQRIPIIHRDVSTANILLVSRANKTWLAKLSDFGSANFARDATTPGEGAVVYSPPECFPTPLNAPSPDPLLSQTTKIDVYSFGVLACEVITCTLPEQEKLPGMMEAVRHGWPQIYQLVSCCIEYYPKDRPRMMSVLTQLSQMEDRM